MTYAEANAVWVKAVEAVAAAEKAGSSDLASLKVAQKAARFARDKLSDDLDVAAQAALGSAKLK